MGYTWLDTLLMTVAELGNSELVVEDLLESLQLDDIDMTTLFQMVANMLNGLENMESMEDMTTLMDMIPGLMNATGLNTYVDSLGMGELSYDVGQMIQNVTMAKDLESGYMIMMDMMVEMLPQLINQTGLYTYMEMVGLGDMNYEVVVEMIQNLTMTNDLEASFPMMMEMVTDMVDESGLGAVLNMDFTQIDFTEFMTMYEMISGTGTDMQQM